MRIFRRTRVGRGSPTELMVGVLSPLPARAHEEPESGVAAYVRALLCGADLATTSLVVLAQESAPQGAVGQAKVLPSWSPGFSFPLQVWRAVRRARVDVLHVQHEFHLYGGRYQAMVLPVVLLAIRLSGVSVVTTIHGVVDPRDVTLELLRRNGLPGSIILAILSLRLAYRSLSFVSHAVVVHHAHFARVLIEQYGMSPTKVQVIPMGFFPFDASDRGPHSLQGGRRVLVLGFLTGYKAPELVAELAESRLLPDLQFVFCVGSNPRVENLEYQARYHALCERVEALGDRADWNGYVPDEYLDAVITSCNVLVLPYTECVSASAVAALAERAGIPTCYSRPLRPLFGEGPLEFELTAGALAEAIKAALTQGHRVAKEIFAPWPEVAAKTEALWLLAGHGRA